VELHADVNFKRAACDCGVYCVLLDGSQHSHTVKQKKELHVEDTL
jgi:hypothetical protein